MQKWEGFIVAVFLLWGCTIKANKDKEPYFSSSISNVTVALGREAILICATASLDTYKVAWIREDDQTVLSLHKRVVTHNSRVTVSSDGDTIWKLHIKQVKESDRGCYTCQINTSSMIKQSGCLDVHVPPEILDSGSSSDVSVDEGGNITLYCQAKGHPMPKIQWRREDNNFIPNTSEEVIYGDALTLTNIDRSQVGAYLCIASNDVPPAVSKRIALSVNYPPEARVSHEVVGAPDGSDIRIFCYIKGYPLTINTWVYKNQTLPHSGRERVVSEETGHDSLTLSLTLYKVETEDFGLYTCQSSNKLGIAQAYFRLYYTEIKTSTTTTTTTTTEKPTVPTTKGATPRTVYTTHDPLLEDYTNPEIDDYENELEEKGVGARSSHISLSISLQPNFFILTITYIVLNLR